MHPAPHSSGPYRSADPYGSNPGGGYGAPTQPAPRSSGGPASYAPSHSAFTPPHAAGAQRTEPYTIFNPAQARPSAAQGGYQPAQGGAPAPQPPPGSQGAYTAHPPPGAGMSEFVGYDAFNSVSSSQAVRFGMNMGQQVINENVKRYVPWLTGMWHSLKYYFAVNHSYVYRKLLTLLFPYRKRLWAREMKDDAAMGADGVSFATTKFQVPMLDENAPDLYIPLMAFITYVLVTGYVKGTRSSFTPEVLVQVTSTCLVAQILEIGVICLGMYLLQAPVNLLDLVAFTGYKYVALNINMVLGVWFGTTAYTISLFYTGAAAAYFVLKSIAQAVKRGYQAQPAGPFRAEFIVLGFALLQLASIWWLGYAGDLKKQPV